MNTPHHAGRRSRRAQGPSNGPSRPFVQRDRHATAARAAPIHPPPLPPAPPLDPVAIERSAFTALGLAAPIVRSIVDEGYVEPTPVQAQVIPHVLAGRDVLACAQTGTGKTAAFVLPLLHHIAANPRAGRAIRVLVITPTRELASQIDERVSVYGRHLGLRHTVVFGGVSQSRQEVALRAGPDVLVATPGRLLDLMQQRLVRLDGVAHLVLDEADRMLDMGFMRDVRTICAALPTQRQTLLFSATMPPDIASAANAFLRDPVRVATSAVSTAATTIEQWVVFVGRSEKRALLERILRSDKVLRAIVFTSTKRGANRLAEQLAHAESTPRPSTAISPRGPAIARSPRFGPDARRC